MRSIPPQREAAMFQEGLEHFNRGEFFAAHESWEEIWLSAAEPEKTLLQGLIQVAAAFHHYLGGNRSGAESLLSEGLGKLEAFLAVHRGIDLESLRQSARRWLVALAAGESPPRAQIPRITPAGGVDSARGL